MKKQPPAPSVVGWHERVSLPDLGIEAAFAKLDTGADTSTLHARDIAVVEGPDGRRAEFTAPLLRNQTNCESWPGGGVRRVSAPVVDQRVVRSSNGEDEERPIIETRAVLGGLEFLARFSLTNREGMRFSVLIGRDALAGRFLVDSSRAHLV